MGLVMLALAVLAAALLLLAVPIDLSFRCRRIEVLDAQLRLAWLFGLVHLDLRWPQPARPTRRAPDSSVAAQAPGRSKGPRRARFFAAMRQRAFRRRLLRLLMDWLRALHIHEFALHLRLGLGDPADTGRLWAIVGPLGAAVHERGKVRLDIEPEFLDAVLEFDARGRLTLIPLQQLALAIAFAMSPPSLRAWRALRTGHG